MTRPLTWLLALALPASLLPAAHAQDAKRGAAKVQMCIGCHGIDGYQADFPQVYKVPKIAGQDARYIVQALTAYRAGDRKHPTMRSIAASLSDQDMADVAAYYAALGKPEQPVPKTPATAAPAALQAKLQVCTTCHGANFSTPTDGTIPRIAGQYADYLAAALHAYQVTDNAVVGRGNAVMSAQAKVLSATDVEEIADYLAGLPGEVRTVQQPHIK